MKSHPIEVLDSIDWSSDHMKLDGLTFRLEHYRNDNWSEGEHFIFYKVKELVDQYKSFFESYPNFIPQNIFEIGMFDGGSVVFWNEIFKPKKHVGIDITDRKDSVYFNEYLTSRSMHGNIKTFWRTDQSDKSRLLELASEHLNDEIDFVIDDASHMYAPTLASFEALFPIMKPGGFYIIEDWAWGHWREYVDPTHPWSNEIPLTRLVYKLIEVAGSTPQLIEDIIVKGGFVAVKRGNLVVDNMDFQIEDYIISGPNICY